MQHWNGVNRLPSTAKRTGSCVATTGVEIEQFPRRIRESVESGNECHYGTHPGFAVNDQSSADHEDAERPHGTRETVQALHGEFQQHDANAGGVDLDVASIDCVTGRSARRAAYQAITWSGFQRPGERCGLAPASGKNRHSVGRPKNCWESSGSELTRLLLSLPVALRESGAGA